MRTSQVNTARLLLIAGVAVASLCGCRSGGDAPRVLGRKQPNPSQAVPAEVGAVKLNAEQKMEIELALARTLEQRGELDGAEAVYRKILERCPEQPESLHRLAVVCDRQGRFEESETLFRKALKDSPMNAKICGDFGYSLYRQGRWSEAEQTLRQAIELDSLDRRAHNHLGLVLAQTGRQGEALEEFARAGCTVTQAQANLALIAEFNGHDPPAQAAEKFAARPNASEGGIEQTAFDVDWNGACKRR